MGCCDKQNNLVQAVTNGVVGLVKVVIGADRTETSLLELRIRACVGHPTNDAAHVKRCPSNGMGLICKSCGCILAAKQKVKSQDCPRGDWPSSVLSPGEQVEWAKKINKNRP